MRLREEMRVIFYSDKGGVGKTTVVTSGNHIWQKREILQRALKGKISVGHNSLAGIIYFLSFLVFLFQSATGFALYSSMSSSFLPGMFSWIVPLMGGDFAVRQWHHMAMWFFIVFSIIHIYLVFYHDYVEGRGTTSSMVGGWKFEREENIE